MNAVRVRPVSTPLGAARRASEVRREPHGDPGAGGDGVGEPDSQSLLARESELPRARSALRQVPIPGSLFVKGGRAPPFTLSPRSGGQRTRGSLPLFLARAAKRRLQNAARRHGNADLPAVAVKMQVPRVRQRSGWRRRSGNAHQKNWADLRSASRRAGTGTPDLRSAALREAQRKACTGPPFG